MKSIKEILYKIRKVIVVFVMLILIITRFKPVLAYRPLKGDGRKLQVGVVIDKSGTKVPLARGPVPPSNHSSCTYIGGGKYSGDHCEIHR